MSAMWNIRCPQMRTNMSAKASNRVFLISPIRGSRYMYVPERKIFDPAVDVKRRTAERSKELFLRGPIPFDWINRACSDRTARLALIIRSFMEMERTSELRISMKICRYAGISDRRQRWRCLQKLEHTGLFEVSASQGRSPIAKRLW